MTKMHDDEVLTSSDLVARLVADQFPHWKGLPVSRVRSSGTDNAMYRLGSDMVVRLPRIAWAVRAVEHEQRWLPHLGPLLPVATPLPLAMGEPAEGYPWSWSVYCRARQPVDIERSAEALGDAGSAAALERQPLMGVLCLS